MATQIESCDALVVGAGVAGLVQANLLAEAGFTVRCLDRSAPVGGSAEDLRTTALLMPAIAALERAGVWEALKREATELAEMRLIDVGDGPGIGCGRYDASFDAAEIEQPIFGYNFANAALGRALKARLEARANARLQAPVEIRHLLLRDDAALVTLADGTRLRAPLAIGADGRESMVRRHIGVAARRIRYDQRAIVFVVSHARPHGNVSIEIHRENGPFVLVPFADDANGAHRSSVVWVESAAEAGALMAMDEEDFALAATARSESALGPLRLASKRMSWPSQSLLADRFHGKRAALIAEAAHAAPPIGAQGLNMSIADAVTLTDLLIEARDAGRDLGDPQLLARYTAKRWPDAAARVAATAALNTAAIGALAPVRLARRAGLMAVSRIKPLKQALMRFGLGG